MKYLLLLLLPLFAQAKQLNVTRHAQETPAWCWLASSEMVLKYNGACSVDKDPDMQCSMMRSLAMKGLAPEFCYFDCKLCASPGGYLGNVKTLIEGYTADSSKNCGPKLVATFEYTPAALTKLKREIKMNRPFMAGINPMLMGRHAHEAEHLVVISGWEGDGNKTIVRVVDPYEYPLDHNPYDVVGAKRVSEGVYGVPYTVLVEKFAWQSSLYVRKSIR
jgi:hypothetical protein